VAREEFVPRVRSYLGHEPADELEDLLTEVEELEGRIAVLDGYRFSSVLPDWVDEDVRREKLPHLGWAAGLGREVYDEWREKFPGWKGLARIDIDDVEEALQRALEGADFVLTLIEEATALPLRATAEYEDRCVTFLQYLHHGTLEVDRAALVMALPGGSVYRRVQEKVGREISREDVQKVKRSIEETVDRKRGLQRPLSRDEYLDVAKAWLFEGEAEVPRTCWRGSGSVSRARKSGRRPSTGRSGS
jgi:hypothetical protein